MTAPSTSTTRRPSAAEILAAVCFAEKSDQLNLARLPAEARALVVAAKQFGYRPIVMYLPDGKRVHALIPAGDLMPTFDVVIQAYPACEVIKGRAARHATWEWV